MRKKIIDFSSAYAQLILLVFLPIVILAVVGAYLVEKESNKSIKSEQRTLATAALIRYEPMVKQILPAMIDSQQAAGQTKTESQDQNQVGQEQIPSLDDIKKRISTILTSMNNDLHIHRIAIIDENGDMLASSGQQGTLPWVDLSVQDLQEQQGFISGIATSSGTAYGRLLGEYEGLNYWLFVDMDNEPLTIAQLKVWLGLGVTGLFTLLVLLLSLNVYAKRWIVPIYDLRLHLQQITPENMYLPVNTDSSGELNQLQQDLVKTLRRLYGDFQELKDHSDQTEEDLRDAFDEMEMQNIFIREARDQAISSSQAKSAFLANISHELRTPLNSIDGFINLLARHGDLTAEQDLYVQTIRKSSAHLLALVNDVLDFSKIEAGKLILDKHEFSLYSAIYDVMDMLSPLAAEKGLRMAVMYYNDVPNNIIGDALRIKQVLTNLVGNAIKFTDVGEVVVRVGIDEVNEASAEVDADNDHEKSDALAITEHRNNSGMIHIAIQDTGLGLSEQAKRQLFKSFSQGDPSITRQYGGTGLGLVISKQLTRLMGGKIGFYNNDNSTDAEPLTLVDPSMQGTSVNKGVVRTGATFWFSIPAYVEMDMLTDIEFGNTFEDIDSEEQFQLPILRPFAQAQGGDDKPFDMLVWINHAPTIQVFMAATRPLSINVTVARSLAGALEKLKEEGKRWDWVVIDGGESEIREDRAALLKQIRLHYQGKLAIYGYQVALDAALLERYKAGGLYQPLDKRQLYRMLDTRTVNLSTMVAPPTWQGVTILAVDDHLPNLLVLDALLSELGIKVITANSGYDAVEIISKQLMSDDLQGTNRLSVDKKDSQQLIASTRQGLDKQDQGTAHDKIDLIFMDVQMPRMSGDEAAKKIRQLESDAQQNNRYYAHNHGQNKRLPIIALTAHGLEEGKERLINAGIDDYVGKPISRPQLLQILQRWLGRGADTPVNSLRKEAQDKALLASDKHNRSVLTDATNVNNKALIVDWRDALVRSANKPELAKQLLMMMQQSVPEELEALQTAWEMRDREELGQVAHRILGASRYSGVPEIRQASQDLEDKCLLNVQHISPPQFTMLAPYYEALVDSLERLQVLDLQAHIADQIQTSEAKSLSENDMIWKMM